jgi:hypothetical protein
MLQVRMDGVTGDTLSTEVSSLNAGWGNFRAPTLATVCKRCGPGPGAMMRSVDMPLGLLVATLQLCPYAHTSHEFWHAGTRQMVS